MSTSSKPIPSRSVSATLTSKGQITIPVEIRRSLGVKAGDKLRFVAREDGIHLLRDRPTGVFEQFRGIGNPEIGSGREAVMAYMRELRGHDE